MEMESFELVHSMAALSIGLVCLMFACVHQQHVIQYRFVQKKNRIKGKKLHTISIDQQQWRRRQQQLCAQTQNATCSSRMAYDKCVCTMQVIEIQAPMIPYRSKTRLFNFDPRCTDSNCAHTLNPCAFRCQTLFNPLRICLSETMQLINKIFSGQFFGQAQIQYNRSWSK